MRQIAILALLPAALAGCHLLLPMQPGGRDQRGSGDGSAVGSELRIDGASDGSPGTEPAPNPCKLSWPPVASYKFSAADPLQDEVGAHRAEWHLPGPINAPGGELVLAGAHLDTSDDPNYCLQPAATGWVSLPPSDDWQLGRGAVSLRVKLERTLPGPEGILARDESGPNDGDLSIVHLPNGCLAARLTAGGKQYWRCTEKPAQTGVGLEVRVIFGSDLLLCVNGQLHAGIGEAFMQACDAADVKVVGGLKRVAPREWIVGATNWCMDAPVYPLQGTIDNLLIEGVP